MTPPRPRKAAGDASAKISKLMGSPPEPSFDESGAMAREDAAPSESRLRQVKAAFKPKENRGRAPCGPRWPN